MAIFTVTIGANTYEVYGGLTAAAVYIGGKFGPAPAAWGALSTDDRGRTLVEATRYLDVQPWDGTRTGLVGVDVTTLEWPRSGVTTGSGTPVSELSVPIEIVQATFELALLVAGDPSVVSKADQGSNIQSVSSGGGVGVTFFNATSARSGTASVMPIVIQRLVGQFLAISSSGAVEGGDSHGGNCVSSFRSAAGFALVRPE